MTSKKLLFFLFLFSSFTDFVLPADERSESLDDSLSGLTIAQFLEGESSPAPSSQTSPKGSAQNSPRKQKSPRNLQPVDLGANLEESHERKETPRAPSPVAVVFAAQANSVVAPLSPNSRMAELEDQARQINRTEGNSKAETKQKRENAITEHQQRLAALIRQQEEIGAQIKSEETQHAQTITTLDENQKATDKESRAKLEALRSQRHPGWWFTRSWTPLVPPSPRSAQ